MITSENATRTRYYSRMRPLYPGAFPKGKDVPSVIMIINFDDKQFCEEIEDEAWGYIDYAGMLSASTVEDYELTPVKKAVRE